MIIEGKKYLCGKNNQAHAPRSEFEKAFAVSLGLGKDIPLQFLSNALKPYKKLFCPRHLFEQIWAPIKNQDVASLKQV